LKKFGQLTVLMTGFLLMYGVRDFPAWGDPQSPASTHLSPHYITHTLEETAVPNVVTSVLADYRGFDTMLETSVIFVAGIAIFAILRVPVAKRRRRLKTVVYEGWESVAAGHEFDLILRTTCRLLIPAIQIFARYVIAHGHHSPGGGFQGGVILAASLILIALAFSLRSVLRHVTEKIGLALSNLGLIFYAGTGTLCLILGAHFLDYGVLAQIYPGDDPVMARSHSILVVEIGVALTVASVLFMIYANLSSHGDLEKGL